MEPERRECSVCGEPFTTTYPSKRTCSGTCSYLRLKQKQAERTITQERLGRLLRSAYDLGKSDGAMASPFNVSLQELADLRIANQELRTKVAELEEIVVKSIPKLEPKTGYSMLGGRLSRPPLQLEDRW